MGDILDEIDQALKQLFDSMSIVIFPSTPSIKSNYHRLNEFYRHAQNKMGYALLTSHAFFSLRVCEPLVLTFSLDRHMDVMSG